MQRVAGYFDWSVLAPATTKIIIIVKGKVLPITGHEGPEGE